MKEKVKLYDKEIYQKAEAIQTIFLILIIFIISFFIGYKVCEWEITEFIKGNQVKVEEQFVEIDNLR